MAGGIRIPQYQLPQEQLRPLPAPYQSAAGATDAAFGVTAGRQVAQAGEKLGEVVLRQAALDNEAAAKSLDEQFATELRTRLFDPEKGYYATKGRAALDAYSPTAQEIDEMRKRYVGMATNPNQARMLTDVLSRRASMAAESMAQHAMRQRMVWQDEVGAARVNGAIADASTEWNDPKKLQLRYNTGLEEALEAVRRQNGGPELEAEARRNYSTKFHSAIIASRMQSDPIGAQQYFEANRATMDPFEAAKLEARLKDASESQIALAAAQRLRGDVPKPYVVPPQYAAKVDEVSRSTGTPANLIAGTIFNESGWKPTARNPGDQRGTVNPKTGRPYDSVGLGQVGEQYAAAAGFDPQDPHASIEFVGKRLKSLADRYGGNWALARLAYGAGEGTVDNWLKQWKAGTSSPDALNNDIKVWMARAMTGADSWKEAQAVWPQIARMLKGEIPGRVAAGQPADPAPGPGAEPTREGFYKRSEAMLPPNASPELRQKFMSLADQEFARSHALWAEKRDGALKDAFDWIDANPGQSITSMPEAISVGLDREMQAKLLEYVKKAGNPTTDETKWEALQRLKGTDPAAFAALNLNLYRPFLSRDDYRAIFKDQLELKNAGPEKRSELISYHQQVEASLKAFGGDPTAKVGTSAWEKNNKIRRIIQEGVQAAEVEKKAKLTFPERQQVIDSLAKDVVLGTREGLLWDSTTSKPRWEITAADVPEAERARIVDALRVKGMEVNDTNIVTLWLARRDMLQRQGEQERQMFAVPPGSRATVRRAEDAAAGQTAPGAGAGAPSVAPLPRTWQPPAGGDGPGIPPQGRRPGLDR